MKLLVIQGHPLRFDNILTIATFAMCAKVNILYCLYIKQMFFKSNKGKRGAAKIADSSQLIEAFKSPSKCFQL
jgi:hypothetical protein